MQRDRNQDKRRTRLPRLRPGEAVAPVPFSAGAYKNGLRRKFRPEFSGGSPVPAGPRILHALPGVPRYWQRLGPEDPFAPAKDEARLNLWLLVLEAKKIPHLLVRLERSPGRNRKRPADGAGPAIYLPALHARGALAEILAVEAEKDVPPYLPPERESVPGVLFFFLLLILWHIWRWYWPLADTSLLPADPGAWSRAFGLDAFRFRALGEYWRAVTALSLHADDAHIFSNAVFGMFLFCSLCRRAGLGLGLLLGIAGGVLGNALTALYREPGALSTGFSTAVFASVGALCLIACADALRYGLAGSAGKAAPSLPARVMPYVRPALAPLAAGLAMLAMLGGAGEANTDYAAHVLGFAGGLGCAAASLPLLARLDALSGPWYGTMQRILYASALGLIPAGWLYALLTGHGQGP